MLYHTVAQMAEEKGLRLVCNYRYELRDDIGLLFWAYELCEIENYLKGIIHA